MFHIVLKLLFRNLIEPKPLRICVSSFIIVLTCLILSVVSTVEQFQDISDHILFYVVSCSQ